MMDYPTCQPNCRLALLFSWLHPLAVGALVFFLAPAAALAEEYVERTQRKTVWIEHPLPDGSWVYGDARVEMHWRIGRAGGVPTIACSATWQPDQFFHSDGGDETPLSSAEAASYHLNDQRFRLHLTAQEALGYTRVSFYCEIGRLGPAGSSGPPAFWRAYPAWDRFACHGNVRDTADMVGPVRPAPPCSDPEQSWLPPEMAEAYVTWLLHNDHGLAYADLSAESLRAAPEWRAEVMERRNADLLALRRGEFIAYNAALVAAYGEPEDGYARHLDQHLSSMPDDAARIQSLEEFIQQMTGGALPEPLPADAEAALKAELAALQADFARQEAALRARWDAAS